MPFKNRMRQEIMSISTKTHNTPALYCKKITKIHQANNTQLQDQNVVPCAYDL